MFLRNAIILGLLTAIGPFAIDMYLPALPVVGTSLGASADAVLNSVTAFFITFALGHMIYGPLSDMYGRKRPLYAGIIVFILASIGCAYANDVQTLILFRVLQGLGAAASIVICRAMVRDLHEGVEEAKLMSLLLLVMSVSPLLAPLAGSLIVQFSNWRIIFWFVTGIAVLGLLLAIFCVRETRPHSVQMDHTWQDVAAACKLLLTDRKFLALTFIGSFGMSGFFVFLGHSSFVFMEHYGLSSMQYSAVFSVNAAAFFIVMQLNAWLAQRFGMTQLMRYALWGYAAVTTILLLLVFAGMSNLYGIVALLFVSYGFLGVVLPISSVLALADHGDIAGTASSLMGTLQLATGAVMMTITSHFTNGHPLPMVAGIASCALVAFALGQVALTSRERPQFVN